MTNEELFTDLKQFIAATVSQQTSQLDQRLDKVEQRIGGVEQQIQELRADMDDQFNTVLGAIGERFEATDARVQDHQDRLHRLERRAV